MPLTEREIEVLRLAAKGFTNKAIGAQLSISDRTVQGHLAKIYDKLHTASRTEAVMRGVSLGLVTADLGTAGNGQDLRHVAPDRPRLQPTGGVCPCG